MSHADDEARAAIERLVPAWARDRAPLRPVQTQQLGRSQADAKLFVPAAVGHIANAARMKLEFESPQDDEAQLRGQRQSGWPVGIVDAGHAAPLHEFRSVTRKTGTPHQHGSCCAGRSVRSKIKIAGRNCPKQRKP